MYKWIRSFLFIIILFSFTVNSYAKKEDSKPEKGGGRPPSKVVTEKITESVVTQEAEFIGTVYYPEVSDLASETFGRVEKVRLRDGQRVKAGRTLVKINSELLEMTIKAEEGVYDEVLLEFEKAKNDFKRIANLYSKKSVAEQTYDDHIFKVNLLEKKLSSLKANLDRLKIELSKKAIKAPFEGVIIKKHVDVGEWLKEGTVIATIAKDDDMDVIVNVPENVMRKIKRGSKVTVKTFGKVQKGIVDTVIPKGDVSTRTFPVKIKLANMSSLIEGMEAKVILSVKDGVKTFTVPRDAVISKYGMNVVFLVFDNKAKMVPVTITGYKGMMAGIAGEGIKKDANVVIKGNERLNDGQSVSESKTEAR